MACAAHCGSKVPPRCGTQYAPEIAYRKRENGQLVQADPGLLQSATDANLCLHANFKQLCTGGTHMGSTRIK